MLRRISWFWLVVGVLFLSAAGFAVGAQLQRQKTAQAAPPLTNGAIVTLDKVVDGDSISVRLESGESVSLRLLGVKAFEPGGGKDPADRFGREAVELLTQKTTGRSLRVDLNNPPKDKYGRYLAILSANEEDIGLELVRRGLVLVYTPYPFPSLGLYLQEQAAARAERRGLWADPVLTTRSDLLFRKWRAEAQ